MKDLNCKEMTEILNAIYQAKEELDSSIPIEKIENCHRCKMEIEELIRSVVELSDIEKENFKKQALHFLDSMGWREDASQYRATVPLRKIQKLIEHIDSDWTRQDKENLGGLISFYINEQIREDGVVILDLRNIKSELRELGFKFAKGTLIIKGDAGECTGIKMVGGEIRIDGNGGRFLGDHMNGGKIVVNGSAQDSTGSFMSGGEIEINGNCDKHAGRYMRGGKITVKGNGGDLLAEGLSGGKIEIYGDVYYVGKEMTGGEVNVHGRIRNQISSSYRFGKIVEHGMTRRGGK